MKATEKSMDKIVALCKNRGFIYAGSEIYGGLANSWDFGPLGVEYKNNVESFEKYYDEIEICQSCADVHFKSALKIRNREMVDRADLVVCFIDHESGGAYQTIQYAKRQNKKIINLAL